ncbi:putative pectinesterase 8 [Asimina triloba]
MDEVLSDGTHIDKSPYHFDGTVFYGEYNCSGAGANISMRVPYLQKLTDAQASAFLNISYIDGDQWLQPFQ